jgi:methyl coenzyme M reductase beta subunit
MLVVTIIRQAQRQVLMQGDGVQTALKGVAVHGHGFLETGRRVICDVGTQKI